MNTKPTYTLGKTERLKSRKAIEQLFKEGRSFSIFPFRILSMNSDDADACLKTAFSVSTRFFKKAVDRNRIKRLMREAWRLQKNALQDHLKCKEKSIAVFIIYTDKELPAYQFIFEKTALLINRLIKNNS